MNLDIKKKNLNHEKNATKDFKRLYFLKFVCVHNSKFIQKTTNCSVPGVVNFVKLHFTDISVKVNAKIFSIVFLNV